MKRIWVVWVTNCFNSSTIEWSPLKNLPVLESLSNGQACDFSRFFRDSGFWKLPERSHLAITCSKSTMETPDMFQVNNKKTRTTLRTSFWRLYFCYLWTYSTYCFDISVVNFEQVNARWGVSWYLWQNLRITNFWCISESLLIINCNK